MAKTTTAGTTFSIGTTATNPSGDTYTAVAEIVDYGEFGRQYQEIKHNPVSTRATEKFKGSYDDGNVTLKLARDMDDAGQTALNTALNSDSDYNFLIELPDGTTITFKGKVMSFTLSIGGPNQMVGGTVMISISGEAEITPG